MNTNITTSIFDIFKIGPGPSSSHTIGPMRAGNDFYDSVISLDKSVLNKALHVKIYLHGSLSATGLGHGTHRAVVAGINNIRADKCNAKDVLDIFENSDLYELDFKLKKIAMHKDDIVFCDIEQSSNFPYANTLIIELLDNENNILLQKEYYSIGGGFIKIKDESEPTRNEPTYKYSNFDELKKILREKNITLSQLAIENEMSITGKSYDEIYHKLKKIVHVMIDSVENGLEAKDSILPGKLNLKRHAKDVYDSAHLRKHIMNRYLIYLNSYALAASEENAAGKIVVTAPTSGSSGLIPALIYFLRHHLQESMKSIIEGMLAASLISFIARENASIAGAEVGCQGEVGVAAAMGAALMASVNHESIEIVENSATIALEHFLGLTCDPIGGYVQIPCIERNAVGAMQSYNAYYLAFSSHDKKLSFDEVVQTMLETGKDMNSKYKETAKGGLATIASIRC
jgi:L-serine dehydratase